MGEKFSACIETFIPNSNTALTMVSGNSLNTGKSSSNLDQSSSLHNCMLNNLLQQEEMVDKLRIIKASNDLKYHDNNGALEVDFPDKIKDPEAERLGKQINVIDTIYNTKYAEYKDLEKRDISINGINHNKVYSSLSSQHRKGYKDLFE